MESLIKILEKKSQQKKQWEYSINLNQSCIYSEQYILSNIKIYGGGNLQKIKVKINFYINNCQKINTRIKKFHEIEKAILYVWNFSDNYNLCFECCKLIKKNENCEECIFFQSYCEYKNKKELCGICQEISYKTMLECKHHFHLYCLLKMDPDELKCPLCRHPVKDDIIYTLFEDSDNDDENIVYSDSE
jgi:hypothetical protein